MTTQTEGVKAGHTKGPWRVVRSDRLNDFASGCRPGNRTAVWFIADAQNERIVGSRGIGKPSSPEGEANARLIAAAPDLLEALEAVLNTSGARPAEGYHALKYGDAVEQAEAAIAKALGQ